ncbi:MAG: cell division protein ZapA [Anaerovoracaceae bacterium]|jgi:cell division protein ZapA
MEERNRVQVKIYGQEYTISGELPRGHIIKVADHVDRSMHKLAKDLPSCSVSSLAVLTAVNCADEYFRAMESIDELKAKNQQLEKDAQHYVQLWDEAKKSFLQYKEDAQSAIESREELMQAYNDKKAECRELKERIRELEEKVQSLQSRNEEMAKRLSAKEEEKASSSSIIKELELRCREMESSFFDLQMENIQLKGELERYKRNSE